MLTLAKGQALNTAVWIVKNDLNNNNNVDLGQALNSVNRQKQL